MKTIDLVLGSFVVGLVAACSGGTASAPGAADGGSVSAVGSSGGPSSSGGCAGLVSCGGECTVLDQDSKHCGGCGKACPSGESCVNAECRAGTCKSLFRTTCGSLCVLERRDPDNCGTCGKRCGAKQTCHQGACVDVLGAGGSCADPIVMPGGGDNVQVGFTFDGANETQVLTCGDPTARPRRVFRFTSSKTKDGARFEVEGGVSTDDLVLEVFGDAACDKGSAIGCNDDDDDDKRPVLRVSIETGKTYYVVVSSKGAPPAGRFYMKFDD